MALRRSFDIDLTPSAHADLRDAGADVEPLIRALSALADNSIFEWERLPLPSGDEGTWVAFQLRGRLVMAQWDKGTPALWNLGAGRGFLKIVRILTREELDDEIKAREASSEEGTTP